MTCNVLDIINSVLTLFVAGFAMFGVIAFIILILGEIKQQKS